MNNLSIEQRIFNCIQNNQLVETGSLIAVAVSGGQDSVCMLNVLNSLKNIFGIRLYVIHIDHQLRGYESTTDASYVFELSKRLDIPIMIKTYNVNNYKDKHHLTLEEAAREIRYTLFAEIVQEIGAKSIAVGHTLDDNVETILMHIIRGTGMRGLRGLQPDNIWRQGNTHVNVIRPMLNISRQETKDYCQLHQLEPRIDSTNLSLSPLRNKIRLQLLPLLESYNPNFKAALLRTAKTLRDEFTYLDTINLKHWNNITDIRKNTVIFNKNKFNRLDTSIKRHLIRMAFEKLVRNLKDIEARHIDKILDALYKNPGKIINLPYGLVFTIEYDRYLLGNDPAALSPFPLFKGKYSLKIPGITQVNTWKVKTKIIKLDQIKKGNRFIAYLDYDKTGGDLHIRTYCTGDRFQPLGMEQDKKLGKFMIDSRIPLSWRNRIPIICSPENILWLVGYRIDNRVKVTDKTNRVIRITYQEVSLDRAISKKDVKTF